jgi:WD40 repeat protein
MELSHNGLGTTNRSSHSLVSLLLVLWLLLCTGGFVRAEAKADIVVRPESVRPVNSAVFSPDSKYVLVTGDNNMVEYWDLDSERASIYKVVRTLTDGWQITTVEETKRLQGHVGPVCSAAFSSDGARVLSASQDGTLKLWDVKGAKEGHEIRTLTGHQGTVLSACLSPAGKHALSGGSDGRVVLWDLESGAMARVFSGHKGAVHSVAFSPDGKLIASGGEDKTVRTWSAETRTQLDVFEGHTGPVLSVSFSSDGRFVVSGSGDSSMKVWDVVEPKEKIKITGHSGAVRSAAFLRNGRYIISGGDDRTVRIYEAATGNEVRLLIGHKDAVHSVAFSPDERFGISGSKDGTTRIWDPISGRELLQLLALPDREWAIITADGFYDTSEDGERWLYVQTAGGTEEIAKHSRTLRKANKIEVVFKKQAVIGELPPIPRPEPVKPREPTPPAGGQTPQEGKEPQASGMPVQREAPPKKIPGLFYQKVPPELAMKLGLELGEGVLVTHVVESSAAAKGDIRKGDVIVLIGGKPVTMVNLFDLIQNSKDKKKITVSIIRNEVWTEKTVALDVNSTVEAVPPDIKVKQMLFFESGKTIPPEEGRQYKKTFESSDTRFVGWKLALSHPQSQDQRKISVEVVCYAPDKSVGSRVKPDKLAIAPRTSETAISSGFGKEKGATWKKGVYKVEVFVDERKVFTDEFKVVE